MVAALAGAFVYLPPEPRSVVASRLAGADQKTLTVASGLAAVGARVHASKCSAATRPGALGRGAGARRGVRLDSSAVVLHRGAPCG